MTLMWMHVRWLKCLPLLKRSAFEHGHPSAGHSAHPCDWTKSDAFRLAVFCQCFQAGSVAHQGILSSSLHDDLALPIAEKGEIQYAASWQFCNILAARGKSMWMPSSL